MRQTQVTEAMVKIQALHASLADLEDPAVELVLGRQCADVAKLSHLLRAAGPWIPQSSLQAHDSMQQAYVERVLAADLDAHSKMQMSIGVSDGGLGFRRATDVSGQPRGVAPLRHPVVRCNAGEWRRHRRLGRSLR